MASPSPPSTISLLLLLIFSSLQPSSPSTINDAALYISKSTFFSDYQLMLSSFKIFIYPHPPLNFTSPSLSLFHTSLLQSPFLTPNPNEAHLFFLPFPPHSTRSLARVIQSIRTSHPYWDRALGADHFYLSCHGVGPSSSRNVVELRKNSVLVSCLPLPAGEFIPHKDLTLPPLSPTLPRALDGSPRTRRLGYMRFNPLRRGFGLIDALRDDPDFLIESGPSDESVYIERARSSKFCLVVYEGGEVAELGAALALGCVPVVITDHPIQDLPLMDVIRLSEVALFVDSRMGHERLKQVMNRTCEGGGNGKMRRLGVAAAHHFVWNESPEPFDAFHMVMYQLWLRRHAIRYARWEGPVARA